MLGRVQESRSDSMKVCSCCRESKDDAEFCKNKGQKDGLSCYCRVCTNLKYQSRYKKEKSLRHEKYLKNKEEIDLIKKLRREQGKERSRLRSNEYRKTHRKQYNEWRKKRRKKEKESNPEIALLESTKYRARKKETRTYVDVGGHSDS